jgi:biofilm PGA synthesis lipoprotein PgaB
MSRWIALCLLLGLSGAAQAELRVLRYADVLETLPDERTEAVSRQDFAAQLDWLAGNGWQAVSLQQVIAARHDGRALPEQSVLLSFDGGHRSLATEVWPLLRAYGWPAVAALPTARIGVDADRLDWAEARAIAAEGSVEFISAGHALDAQIAGEPMGLGMPKASTRAFIDGRYENPGDYAARMNADLAHSQQLFERELGAPSRAVAWPYGAWSAAAQTIAAAHGMTFGLAGAAGGRVDDRLPVFSRLDLSAASTLADLAAELRERRPPALRAMQIDLDYVYDADPVQLERNLDALVERVRAVAPTTVWLQAFADPDGNGAADAVYFPNRHLPMRADLFGRVAWLLRTRAYVQVHAWMPVLGWEWPVGVDGPRMLVGEAGEIPRIDPTDPGAARYIGDLYQDMAAHAHISGLLFHDDALLRDSELREALPEDAQRVQLLIEFTRTLEARAESVRPRLASARNLYARPVLQPEGVAGFAQTHASMLASYDHVALMAMPWLEGASDPQAWLLKLAEAVATIDPLFERTVFVLQSRDWNTGRPLAEAELIELARQVRARGVRHLAYYPDDFIGAQPSLRAARAMASARRFPYLQP